ncbi:hypothetical protein GWI33_019272 [Rhynchophorus ferrugineus]|uniref:Uncharacterized protein n=1 Tax=Rhynchophorus ferrugineus TaxID=354439 RepID=A0A834I5P2_RHYFE|nr:hypothetical protein GWI33_019272 [Rhynchophorus ferrugineus]
MSDNGPHFSFTHCRATITKLAAAPISKTGRIPKMGDAFSKFHRFRWYPTADLRASVRETFNKKVSHYAVRVMFFFVPVFVVNWRRAEEVATAHASALGSSGTTWARVGPRMRYRGTLV